MAFRFYNPNPLAIKKIDCSVRALCRVTGMTWDEVHKETSDLSRMMGTMPVDNAAWGAFLRMRGWKRYAVPNSCPDCYTVRAFCRDHPWGYYVLCPSGHVVAAVDGDWFDIFDSGDEVLQYFWSKEELSNVW